MFAQLVQRHGGNIRAARCFELDRSALLGASLTWSLRCEDAPWLASLKPGSPAELSLADSASDPEDNTEKPQGPAREQNAVRAVICRSSVAEGTGWRVEVSEALLPNDLNWRRSRRAWDIESDGLAAWASSALNGIAAMADSWAIDIGHPATIVQDGLTNLELARLVAKQLYKPAGPAIILTGNAAQSVDSHHGKRPASAERKPPEGPHATEWTGWTARRLEPIEAKAARVLDKQWREAGLVAAFETATAACRSSMSRLCSSRAVAAIRSDYLAKPDQQVPYPVWFGDRGWWVVCRRDHINGNTGEVKVEIALADHSAVECLLPHVSDSDLKATVTSAGATAATVKCQLLGFKPADLEVLLSTLSPGSDGKSGFEMVPHENSVIRLWHRQGLNERAESMYSPRDPAKCVGTKSKLGRTRWSGAPGEKFEFMRGMKGGAQ